MVDLRENSSADDDILAKTAAWLDSFDSGRVLIGTEDQYGKLRSSFGEGGRRWGLAPNALQGDGNLYINSNQGRGDQLITAVHEVGHENGMRHGDQMRRQDLGAYNGLLPSFRSSATRHYEYLWGWFGSIVKRPGGGS